MNNGQKVVAAMLAVAVVVLAMVAFAPRPPTDSRKLVGVAAWARPFYMAQGRQAGGGSALYRAWDDGTVEWHSADGWQTVKVEANR